MIKFLVALGVVATSFAILFADDSGALTLTVVSALGGFGVYLFRRETDSKDFITYVFLSALCARLLMGVIIHVYDIRDFVGPDSFGYDYIGSRISDFWLGSYPTPDAETQMYMSIRGSGWGMNYLMGILYTIFGQNIFLAQSVCALVGAASVPMTYLLTKELYQNERVSRIASISVAFFPAFVIWSSQLLKDGLILFLLVVIMTCVLRIQKKFSVWVLTILIFSMAGILSLRFYIFYMVALAVIGGFLIGTSTSFKSIFQRSTILIVIGLVLTYLGVIRTAGVDLQTYGSLERIQVSRSDLVQSASSGFEKDADVSTLGGAIAALPMGFLYLIFAPFPWEMKNLRQSLALPDVLIWWSLVPFAAYGLWYTVRYRLRLAIPILIFTMLLTISYSIFQGNVGAAHRQRTQIQVFLFVFISVAIGVLLERREDRRMLEKQKLHVQKRLSAKLQQPGEV
jgi:hypothetical protein